MSSDVLHDIKTAFDAPTLGTTEKLEGAAKSLTRELGLEPTSRQMEKVASRFAVLMEYYGLAQIARRKNISFNDGMSKHMFFFDDKIVNAVVLLGCGIALISNFSLALPLAGIGAFYFGSDKFLKTIEKL